MAETTTTANVKWAAPTLNNPTIIDLNKTGSQTWWGFRPDEDVIFIAPTTPRTLGRLQTDGGNNIVLIGGDYFPTSNQTATLYFTNLHGSVHVEGVHIDNKNSGAHDAIAVYGASGKQPNVTIQNSLIENVTGTNSGAHGDVFQTHGPVGDIRMYNVTGSTNYQGLFIAPQAATRSADLENVNMKWIPGGDNITYQYWFLDNASEKPFPITLKNVHTTERSGQSAENASVWPKAGLGEIGAVRVGDQITWPGLPYNGSITVGAPASGDFAKAANVGGNYNGGTPVPTDPVDPTAPVDPTDPVDPTNPTDPVDPVDPTPVDPADLSAPSGAPTNWIGNTPNPVGTAANDQIAGQEGVVDANMAGGRGDDTYIVDLAADKVTENANEGVDTVLSYAPSYTLPGNVEHLVLGGTVASSGTGNGLANRITGNGSDNVLDGAGGNDLLTGGLGNDTFVVAKDQGNDIIADFVAGAGAGDKVDLKGFSFADFAAVKEAMTASGSDVVLDLGNGQTLTFRGTTVDTFAADDFGFTVTPADPTDPTDPVDPTAPVDPVDPTPPTDPVDEMPEFFNLPVSGAPARWYVGTAGDNTINASAVNDHINGRGGSDTMTGKLGDDTYVVDTATDTVIEKSGEGVDTVKSSASSYSLSEFVEHLTLTGKGDIAGTGNEVSNRIVGNSGDNALNGGAGDDILVGGKGEDSLTGGAGSDMFVFNSLTEKGDTITDFEVGKDMLDLRPLMASLVKTGVDPVVEHYLSLVQDGTSATAVMIDPTGSGTAQTLVTLENVKIADLTPEMVDQWA